MLRSVNKRRFGPRSLRSLATDLVVWYEANARDLPWRRTRDPYRIWVSEVMLQQTRVEVVAGRWERFLQRFPTLQALARARESEVLAEWAGLGYYRRARQLHAAARALVHAGDGALPEDAAALRLLPGFGRYTAGAVASIAFGQAVPAVDGNVERVVSRLLALDGDPSRGAPAKEIHHFAAALVECAEPSAVNQGLMELGATVCAPRDPRCSECPWQRSCAARRTGLAGSFPRRTPRPTSLDVASYAAVARRGATLLWRRRPAGGHNAGLWELPTTPWHPGAPEAAAGRDALEDLARDLGRQWDVKGPLARVRHGITHHRIALVAHEVDDDGDAPTREDLRWAAPGEAEALGLTAATTKILHRLPTLL